MPSRVRTASLRLMPIFVEMCCATCDLVIAFAIDPPRPFRAFCVSAVRNAALSRPTPLPAAQYAAILQTVGGAPPDGRHVACSTERRRAFPRTLAAASRRARPRVRSGVDPRRADDVADGVAGRAPDTGRDRCADADPDGRW